MADETEHHRPPLVVWDGECGFCRTWTDHWKTRVGDEVSFATVQSLSTEELQRWDLDPVICTRAMHFVAEDDSVLMGGAAVAELLSHAPESRYQLFAKAYARLPGARGTIDAIYGRIADHRPLAARLTRIAWGEPHRETFVMARRAFRVLLGLAALIAFWSMWRQIGGLIGTNGILPAADYLDAVAQHVAARGDEGEGPWLAPSIFWLTASDTALRGVCVAGMVAAGGMIVGIAPRLMAAACWGLYLSIVSVGQVFLGYQWDALLLEALFVGVFCLPAGFVPGRKPPSSPTWTFRWLAWLLVFKLMFLAGWVKLEADEVWRNLTALEYHFWTQPIPNSLAWHAHFLPGWLKSSGVAFTLVAETIAPLLVFAPRRPRHVGALLMIALQLFIMATGTYGFFNILTIALCVTLFDDRFFGRPQDHEPAASTPRARMAGVVLVAVGCLVLMPMSRSIVGWPAKGATATLFERLAPLRTFNSYGLFANMTEDRPELVVEGTTDGSTWFTYDFRWKPTDVDEPLRMTTFHMPRVDWQMWFAALGNCARNGWYHRLVEELLRGNEEVLQLLEGSPSATPERIRTRFFQYRFDKDGVWERKLIGEYCPTLRLGENDELTVVR